MWCFRFKPYQHFKLISNSKLFKRNFNFNVFSKSKSKTGFYVMLPEIPKDTSETNELLKLPQDEQFTRFSLLNLEKCVKAIGKLSIEFESCLDSIDNLISDKKIAMSFDELIYLIEKHLVPFDFALRTTNFLKNVQSDKFNFVQFDRFYNRVCGVRSKRFHNEKIYYFLREINSDRDKLSHQQKRVLDKYLLEAKLSGINLSDDDKDKLRILNNSLHTEKMKFSENLNEATRRFKQTIDDPSLLNVFPDELISAMGNHNNVTVTLQTSIFMPFMEYCPDRMLRWNLWQAYNSRASPLVDPKISNSLHIEEIRSVRKKMAQTLGFDNYAELSMQTKMAGSIENVKSMINTLHSKSAPKFQECLTNLSDFAEKSGEKLEQLQLWDLPFWQRKLLKSQYCLDDVTIKKFFPLSSVLDGMFQLAQRLFSIKIEEVSNKNFDPWHPDVKLFRILTKKGIAAHFLFDPFSRNGKLKGSWIENTLSLSDSLKTKPIAYFVMNLSKTSNEKHVLLSFNDVLILFKEFGRILQHSLTEMHYYEISGLSNLEWDTINLCSEFFGLWPLHSYKVLSSCSSHIKSGDQIPEETYKTIRNAHYHFASINLKQELYRSALDLALYSHNEHWLAITDQTWDEYMKPFKREKYDLHLCSFREIFCDQLPAAYFSFKWAQMIAADAFSAFQESNLEDDEMMSKIGARFRDTFLCYGGGSPGSEVFRRFRGRDPSPDALLSINDLGSKQLKEKIREKSIQ